MIGTVVLVGFGTVAGGGVLSAVRRRPSAGLAVQAVGASMLGLAGFWILLRGSLIGQPFGSGLEPRFGVDGLSGLFLGALGLVAAPALVFSQRYLDPGPRGRAVAALTAAFLLVLGLVLCARDPFTFLFGWEAMTLLPAAVILVSRGGDDQARRTVFTYLAITHLGGVGTWVAVLLLAHADAFGGPGATGPGLVGADAIGAGAIGAGAIHTGSGLQLAIALTALFGMGTKAGVMPLHVWLPRAHPIAPAPVSALMSGVMIKVAIYGLVRVLVDWLGVLPVWFGVLVLALGALSAVGGVVYALFQHELKRLLALHSIENIGIILLGLAACLILRAEGAAGWAAFALGAALLHTLNHAVFKALLFLGAGAFERATGSLHLDRLGGLLRQMPWTGSAFLIGAMAIAGLPPLNGFASEWVTLQALLRLPGYGGVLDGIAGAIALAALAATAGLALTCFVKVVGLVLLGPARARDADHEPVREAAAPMVAAMGFLAGVCVVLGVAPGLLFGSLTRLAPWVSGTAFGTSASGTSASGTSATVAIGLHLPGTGGLPTAGIAAVLVALVCALSLARGRRAAAPAPSWACGQQVDARLNWTSVGFTKPLRLVLEVVLRPKRQITVRTAGGVTQEVSYRGHVPQLIDEQIYRPVAKRSIAVAAHARRLQSGSLGTYVAYLIGLVVLLLGAARIGVIR